MYECTHRNRGRKSIPSSLLEARREYAVGLRNAGVSISEIHRTVNKLAEQKGWGRVTLRTIERDIAKYYENNNPLTPQDYNDFFELREAGLAQMEMVIEKLSLYIANKKDWKPFEYPSALFNLFEMQMKYAELQNWNLSKKNMDFDFRHRELNTA